MIKSAKTTSDVENTTVGTYSLRNGTEPMVWKTHSGNASKSLAALRGGYVPPLPQFKFVA
jgi:hypothetical protein